MAPITSSMIMIAIPNGSKYWSTGDAGVPDVVVADAAASSTMKLACEVDGQYPFVPAKEAKTVYLPTISGFHDTLNEPLESVVAVPICL